MNKKHIKKMNKHDLVEHVKHLDKLIKLQLGTVCLLEANIEELEYDSMELQAENIELGNKISLMTVNAILDATKEETS